MGGFCEVYLLTPVLGLGHVVSFCWESQKLEQGIEEGVRPRQIVLVYVYLGYCLLVHCLPGAHQSLGRGRAPQEPQELM